MKLRLQPGPLPVEPPRFDWEEDDFEDDLFGSDEEIDLTDLFDLPKPVERTELN
jgi:hypothetical protein